MENGENVKIIRKLQDNNIKCIGIEKHLYFPTHYDNFPTIHNLSNICTI